MSTRRRWAASMLVAASMLAGCASDPPKPSFVGAAPAAAESAAAKPAAIPASLRFTGKTLDGKPFDAAKLAGKPAVLWFWAPWCATCASEAQSIRDLADEYHGKLGILGIAGMGDNKAMHQFVSDLEVGAVPHLDDQAGKIWKKFGITQQSLYVFVNRDGKIVKTGYLDDLQLTAEVKSLVA